MGMFVLMESENIQSHCQLGPFVRMKLEYIESNLFKQALFVCRKSEYIQEVIDYMGIIYLHGIEIPTKP